MFKERMLSFLLWIMKQGRADSGLIRIHIWDLWAITKKNSQLCINKSISRDLLGGKNSPIKFSLSILHWLFKTDKLF